MNILRVQKLQKLLVSKKASAVLVSNYLNIFYLSGFIGISPNEREALLLVKKGSAYLFVPRMYGTQAKSALAPHINLILSKERDSLFNLVSEYINQKETVLFEENDLSVFEFEGLKKKVKAQFFKSESIIEELRKIKDEEEIVKIKKAVALTDKAFDGLVNFLKETDYTKLTEQDLVEKFRQISKRLGADSFGFDPVIAIGEGSAQPHYSSKNKKLKKGELLLFDIGLKSEGYTADLTRCVSLGKASNEVRNIYEIVLEANRLGIEAVKQGVKAEEPFHKVNNFFKEKKVEELFLHGLGHGVGLEIHEEPFLRSGQKTVLEKNMLVTVEPGVYLENKFGIRIEDLVLIVENGLEVLSKSPKHLIEI